MNYRDVNGPYCLECYRDRRYLIATGAIKAYQEKTLCNGCGGEPVLWAVLSAGSSFDIGHIEEVKHMTPQEQLNAIIKELDAQRSELSKLARKSGEEIKKAFHGEVVNALESLTSRAHNMESSHRGLL